jgi:23S rRNA pseudouridine2605 synthase
MKDEHRSKPNKPRPATTAEARPADAPVRLQKYLAMSDVASRRHAEELIAEGRVQVNGVPTREMGVKVLPGTDSVMLDGKVVTPATRKVYYMLNKPPGYLVTSVDGRGRATIYDLLGSIGVRVVPVGRLDLDSEGLLLLTNDGDLAYRLTHPKFEIEKEYEAWVRGKISKQSVEELRSGVELEDGRTQPAVVRVASRSEKESRLYIIIGEGRKRQVRRMLDAVGHRVERLRRVREGSLRLGPLARGEVRALTPIEVRRLLKEVRHTTPRPR